MLERAGSALLQLSFKRSRDLRITFAKRLNIERMSLASTEYLNSRSTAHPDVKPDDIMVYLSGTFPSLRALEIDVFYGIASPYTQGLDFTSLCAPGLNSLVLSSTETLRWHLDILSNLTTLKLRYDRGTHPRNHPDELQLLDVLSLNPRLKTLHLFDVMCTGGFHSPDRNSTVLNLLLLADLSLGDTIPNLQALLPVLRVPNAVVISITVSVEAPDEVGVASNLSAACGLVRSLVDNVGWAQAALPHADCQFEPLGFLEFEARNLDSTRKIGLQITDVPNIPDVGLTIGTPSPFPQSLVSAFPLAQLTS